jgi:hypothetical protein
MTNRRAVLIGLSAAAISALSVAAASAQTAGAQGKSSAGQTYKTPRLADGKPDLQGVWDYRSITPLETPSDAAGKAVYSDEEAAEVENRAKARNQDRRDGAGTDADVGRAYNDFWWDFGKKLTTKRTALIVDPPDGKLPPMTPEGQKRVAAGGGFFGGGGGGAVPAAGAAAAGAGGGGFRRGSDSWLDRSTWERCLTFGAVPRLSGAYNNNFSIFQGSDAVVLQYEMIHENRVIPTDGRAHGNVRQWLGDSRGHWEGDTLVVDTVNFTDKMAFRGASENLHLIERFTRTGPDSLLYEFTVDDPATWTKPWKAQVPILKNSELMYEYACHEGNYGMYGILAGARALEKAAAEPAKKGSN